MLFQPLSKVIVLLTSDWLEIIRTPGNSFCPHQNDIGKAPHHNDAGSAKLKSVAKVDKPKRTRPNMAHSIGFFIQEMCVFMVVIMIKNSITYLY